MIGLIVWVALAVVFGMYDLQISIAIADDKNPFGIFGAVHGEGPGWGIFIVALVVLISSSFSDVKKQKNVAIGIGIGLVCVFIAGLLLESDTMIEIGGYGGIGTIILALVTMDMDWKPWRTFAILVVFLFLINPTLFVTVTKPICGRVRFRDLTPPLYPEYTPWYAPPWFDLDNLSFPSGHTAMGWMTLPLLIPLRDKKMIYKVLGSVLVVGWGFFVGLSRILVEAHYASDVLFSTGVAFVAVILLYKKYYMK